MTGIIITNPPTVELPPGNNNNNPASLPGITYLSAFLSLPQTWTAAQTYLPNTFQLAGSSIGTLTLNAPATASGTITFPPGNTDFSATGGASKVVKQTTLGGPFTVGQLAYSDISGTVPAPTSTTLGGVKSLANVPHQWLDSIGTDGTPTQTQPAFSDIFGTAAVSQGGTGQITASAAFDALSPTTTRGDIIYRNAVTNTRLPAGTAGFVLQANGAGADPSWVSVAATATPVMDGAAAVGVATKYAREDHVHPTDTSRQPNITGWAASGVPTLTEFTGGQISTQGVLGNSLSVYATPTAIANSTVFSAVADQSSLSGSGTAPVANFGATTGASQTAHVRVISSFLEDYSTTATQPVSLFAMANKHGGNASQSVFAGNLQVVDNSAGSGAIIGLEIDVDGKSTTTSSLGLGIYGRNNGSAFNGGNAMLVTSAGAGSWSKGLVIDGNIAESGLNTVTMTTSPTAVHMANNQRLSWDGGTPGTVRSWIVFNQAAAQFQFFIDGAMIGHIP